KAAERFYNVAKGIHIDYGKLSLGFKISIGITSVRDTDDMSSIVSRADRYMFEAKEGHRAKKIVTDDSTHLSELHPKNDGRR
ncbi:MAG: hypothetical protein ACI4LM_05535, partial [Anaerovoracaceae bacterium]